MQSPSPFELRSLPGERNKPRVYLIQLPYKSTAVASVDEPVTMSRIDGPALDCIKKILEDIVGDVTQLTVFLEKGGIVPVSEEAALRIGIASIGINSLRSTEKMVVVIDKVRSLDGRDIAYWFEKLIADSSDTAAGAFRYFLTGQP